MQGFFWYNFAMYQKKSRKKELARRTAIYAIMTLSVIGLMIILMYTILGYQYNFETRKVEQTGLVQFDSHPRGARVSVDGQQFETTQTKNTVQSGQHQFSMTLNGYEPWQKTLSVEPGGVTWLNYARLVPTEKNITTSLNLSDQQTLKASPDRRYIAGVGLSQDSKPQLTLIDFRDASQPVATTHLLDTSVVSGFETATTHSFQIVEWSYASRYLLVKHVYAANGADQTEWLLVDRESPTAPINITTKVSLAFTDVQFAGERELYGLQSNGDLRRISMDSNTVSGPVLTKVTDFQVYVYDIIAYTAVNDEQVTAGVWKKGWESPTVLKSAAKYTALHIRVSSYFRQDTVVVAHGNSVTIYRGVLPKDETAKAVFMQSPKTFTLNRRVTNIQTSGNGRFVVAEDGGGMISYDLERNAVSQELKKHNAQTARWIDDYHLWQITATGQLEMREFDGVNSHELMPLGDYEVLLTSNERFIYGFVKNNDGTLALRRLSMTVSN